MVARMQHASAHHVPPPIVSSIRNLPEGHARNSSNASPRDMWPGGRTPAKSPATRRRSWVPLPRRASAFGAVRAAACSTCGSREVGAPPIAVRRDLPNLVKGARTTPARRVHGAARRRAGPYDLWPASYSTSAPATSGVPLTGRDYLRQRSALQRLGLTRQQAEYALLDYRRWIETDIHAHSVDPSVLDRPPTRRQ